MGIFDFFKDKKADNNSGYLNDYFGLIQWQNIIQHDNSDTLYMTKDELLYNTQKYYLPNTLRIINDCIDLIK